MKNIKNFWMEFINLTPPPIITSPLLHTSPPITDQPKSLEVNLIDSTKSKKSRYWSDEEHKKFLDGIYKFGLDLRKIAIHVGTRTAVQVRTHLQKFQDKVAKKLHKPVESLTLDDLLHTT